MACTSKPHLVTIAALAGALALASPTAHAATFNNPADVQAIAAIEQALANGTDMNKLIGYYAPDAFVEDLFAPGIYRGRAQIKTGFSKELDPLQSLQGKVLNMSVYANQRFACAAVRTNFDAIMKSGAKLALASRELDVFQKVDGKWQIIQQQVGVPVDPKTGLGLMNANVPDRGSITWSADPVPGPATTPALAKAGIRQWLIDTLSVTSPDGLADVFGPSKTDVLLYDLALPGEFRGYDEIRAHYVPLLAHVKSINGKLFQLAIASDGKFGAEISTQEVWLHGTNGSVMPIAFRQSDCLSYVNGKWVTFFEMLSFPVDPKTGKSVTH